MKKSNCICGCGGEARPGNKYIRGHNRRGKVSFTSKGRWSMKYDFCRGCGTTKRKHNREGYCSKCVRRLRRSGKIEPIREPLKGAWSKGFSQCQECGTVERPHQAKGLCGNCWQNQRNRKLGMRERNFGAWSWYYDCCVSCGTVDRPHCAKGLCVDCNEEAKRSETFGEDLDVCPVCGVKTVKLQQHIAMRAHKCVKHLKVYNKVCAHIVDAFSTDKTSQQTADEFGIAKSRVLKIWHENFTDEDIKVRGEKIRVSKISGENNYLYGQPAPLISNNLIKFVDIKDRFYIMRSTWEIKYAEYLDQNKIDWEYEEHKFKYYDLNGLAHYYFPDFYFPKTGEFVEIKGYMDDKSRYKIDECTKVHGIVIKVLQKNDLCEIGLDI